MSMEFDKRKERSLARKSTRSESEKRSSARILHQYPRMWQLFQTRFLEDLILS